MRPGVCDCAGDASGPRARCGEVAPGGCSVAGGGLGGGYEGRGLLAGGSQSEGVARCRQAPAAEGSGVGGAVRLGSACCSSPRAASASSRDPSVWRQRELGSNPPVTLTSCAAVGGYSAFPCVHLLVCKMGIVVPTSGRRGLRTRVLLRAKSREQPWKAPPPPPRALPPRPALCPSSPLLPPGSSRSPSGRRAPWVLCCVALVFRPVLSSVPVAP